MDAVKGKIAFFEKLKYDKGFTMSGMHFHRHYEVYYLVSGKTKYFIGSEIFLLIPGDFVFIPKGEFHRTDSNGIESLERILINFDDSFIDPDYIGYLVELLSLKHIRIHESKLHVFHSIFKKMEDEEKTELAGCNEMKKLYLEQMLIMISRYKRNSVKQELKGSYKIIQDAAMYIKENFSQNIDLDFLAQKYAMSSGHFSKLFKRVTGVKLTEYITVSRIMAAQEMLSSENKNITEVAIACGFNDSNYFTRVFKRETGMTPKKYAMQFI